jgi:two-component system, sensor histidine kinase
MNTCQNEEERYQEQLDEILDTINEVFWSLSWPEGKPVFISRSAEKLYGIPIESFLNDPLKWNEVVHPEDRGLMEETMDTLKREGKAIREFRIIRGDGTIRWVNDRSYLIKDKSGTIVRINGVASDITDRKRTEVMLEKKAAVNEALAEIARALTSPGTTIEQISQVVHNKALQLTDSFFGYVSSIDPETEENIIHTLSSMMEGEECKMEHKRVVFPKGEKGYNGLWGHALNTKTAFFTNNPVSHLSSKGIPRGHIPIERFLSVPAVFEGTLYGQIALANANRDYGYEDVNTISSLAHLFAMAIYRKQSEKDLLASREAAEQSNRAKNDFLASMSHELKTPLNAIIGFGQLLLEEEPDPELRKDYAQELVKGGDRLLELVNCILDYSKVESGALSLEAREVDSRELIEEAVQYSKSIAEQYEVRIVIKPIESPLPVLVDPQRMLQVLMQIIGNGIKFNKKSGQVIIEADQSDTTVTIRIQDTGEGIPEEKLKDLFIPFDRMGRETGSIPGTGIGLLLTKKLLEQMHGSIKITSSPGSGSRVEITLPIAQSSRILKKGDR